MPTHGEHFLLVFSEEEFPVKDPDRSVGVVLSKNFCYTSSEFHDNFMGKKLLQIQKRLLPIFRQYGVIRADVFGSVARGEAKAGSDLDLIVTLKKPIGIFMLNELNDKLETSLRTKVDLLTHQSINRHLRPYIINSMVRIYEEKQ